MKLYLSQTFFLFQLYKGEDTSFQISGLQNNTDYRFRVYVCRRCQDSTQELCGPLSPSSLFTQRRMELNLPGELNSPETLKPSGMFATDERFAAVLVGAFAALSFLIAFVVEYFFMKWKYEMNVQPAASQEKKKFWETHEHLKYTSYATYCRLIMLYRLSSCLSFSFSLSLMPSSLPVHRCVSLFYSVWISLWTLRGNETTLSSLTKSCATACFCMLRFLYPFKCTYMLGGKCICIFSAFMALLCFIRVCICFTAIYTSYIALPCRITQSSPSAVFDT